MSTQPSILGGMGNE